VTLARGLGSIFQIRLSRQERLKAENAGKEGSMSDKTSGAVRKSDDDESSDLVWGARGIGRVINRTEAQTHHLLETGVLDDAVTRLTAKTIVGSRRALLNLPFRKSK
jgi:hypothetical protein